mmetsp:Transcript_125452/g.366430  ORF Transcript_125452/g.366430 Transcript_125452/m.366430 type:complete len:513 (-) Transcript_125452:42-1580(-)
MTAHGRTDEEGALDRAAARVGSSTISVRPCLVVTFLFWSTQWTELDLSGAFYRSLVECDPPTPSQGGTCPVGTVYHDGACKPLPRGDDDWSGSAHCFDKTIAVTQSTALGGRVNSLNCVGQVFANSLFGVMLIDTWGRKPMMVLSLCGYFLCCLLFVLVCLWGNVSNPFTNSLLYLGILIAALLNTFVGASTAMAADGMDAQSEQRSSALAVLNIAKTAGIFVGFGGGYFVLLADLEDYFLVWTAVSLLILIFIVISLCVLRETRPEAGASALGEARLPLRAAEGAGRCRSEGVRELGAALRLLRHDRFLCWVALLSVLGNGVVYGAISLSGAWAILVCGYSQAVASLAGIVQPAFIIVGSAMFMPMARAIGKHYSNFVGQVLLLVGLLMTGLGGFSPSLAARVLFWLGWGVAVGLGLGIITPAVAAIMSPRVADADQGKLFAGVTFFAFIGIASSTYFFTNVLLSGGDEAGAAARLTQGFFISGAGQAMLLLCWIVLYMAYIMPSRSCERG